jgi:hypothetical protein
MSPTLFQIGVAIVMVAVSVALIVWFARSMTAASARRTMQMLTRAGVGPEVARHADTEAIIRDVRRRCIRCRSEDLCDRWLAGKVEGDHSFCPNVQLFHALTGITARSAP